MCTIFHVKNPLFLSDFKENWIFSEGFGKIHKYQISIKLFFSPTNAPSIKQKNVETYN
jgi:hypothetical protein